MPIFSLIFSIDKFCPVQIFKRNANKKVIITKSYGINVKIAFFYNINFDVLLDKYYLYLLDNQPFDWLTHLKSDYVLLWYKNIRLTLKH